MPLSPGQMLDNRYRVVQLLGQGGFGAVYRVWDTRMDRPMALKENLDTSPEAQRQFKREAQILFDLSHPNMPRVIDHFVVPGQGQYLVMEFVEGEDLLEMLQRVGGPLPVNQALEWIGQICDALQYLHSQNPPIIHRDIKPANIKITLQGKAMLVDFGIAKVFDPKLSTTVGARAITPGYSPQEQYGTGTTDARTDVYALGATLYHLLTGMQPPESIQRNIDDTLAPPRALNPAISTEVETAVLRAMKPLPQERFDNVSQFKIALMPALAPTPMMAQTMPASNAQAAPTPHVQAAPSDLATHKLPSPVLKKWQIALGAIILAVVAITFLIFGGRGDALQPAIPTSATQVGIAGSTPGLEPSATGAPPSATAGGTVEPSATLERFIPPSDTPVSPSATLVATEAPVIKALPSQIVDDFGVSMALVPAGEFQMGRDIDKAFAECQETRSRCYRGWYEDEGPVHSVYLDAYYIDQYEVTNALYASCVRAGVCTEPTLERAISSYYNGADVGSYYGKPRYDGYPVVFVTWKQALKFCEWRGGRLPTEAEWEKAARGGLEGKLYSWGDDPPICEQGVVNGARFDDNLNCNGIGTAPVGSYAPNGFELFDMIGNVREWVWDKHSVNYYTETPFKNPQGPLSGEFHVVRGGAWGDTGDSSFSFSVVGRSSLVPAAHYDDLGLRCARPIVTEVALPESATPALEISPPASTATPAPKESTPSSALPVQIVDDYGARMALVPAGKFMMGSANDPNADENEEPQHAVYLDAYYIDLIEVTNDMYRACVESGNCMPPKVINTYTHADYYGMGDYPVVNIDWEQAQIYCEWRNAQLPTEAQWEKAARGTDARLYPWGNELDCSRANYMGCVGDYTKAGSYPEGASPYGVLDMAGNVAEWVRDWFDEEFYNNSSLFENPSGPDLGKCRVVRGGNWFWGEIRAAGRSCENPFIEYEYRSDAFIGFRCVRSP